MTTIGDAAEVLVVRRQIPFPREQVFAAWLDAASLAQWISPRPASGATVEVDPRVGGKFRIVMHKGQDYEHRGEYLAIEPPSLLSFTWISKATDLLPTVVTIEFLVRGSGTELVLTHQRLPQAKVKSHRDGWTIIVRQLEEAVGVGADQRGSCRSLGLRVNGVSHCASCAPCSVAVRAFADPQGFSSG